MRLVLQISVLAILAWNSNCEEPHGKKILFLLPLATKSHCNVFEPLIDGMRTKGHHVTVIWPLNKKIPSPPNMIEISPVSLDEFVGQANPFQARTMGKWAAMASWESMFLRTCKQFYEHEEIEKMIQTPQKFDLIIINGMLNHCVLGFLHKFNAPFIYLTTLPSPNFVSEIVGNHFPHSFIPSPFNGFSDEMTFLQRVINSVTQTIVKVIVNFMYVPKMEALYKTYIPDAPDLTDIEKNVSMIFMNTHFSMTYPRPLLPDVIEVGGMHCKPPNPLPQVSLKTFY